MSQISKDGVTNLPVPVGPVQDHSGPEIRPEASFVAHLIAARNRMPLQRRRRQAEPAEALDAYAHGEALDVVRMPQGYRKTVIV